MTIPDQLRASSDVLNLLSYRQKTLVPRPINEVSLDVLTQLLESTNPLICTKHKRVTSTSRGLHHFFLMEVFITK